MIERKYNLHAPVLDFFNGWASAIIISFAVHGAMIWAVIILSGDISKPNLIKAFNVEVVVESAPEKTYDTKKTKNKHIKILPGQIAPPSITTLHQSPQNLVVKEKIRKTISIVPKTTKTNSTIQPIYALEPKHKPDIPRQPSKKNLDSQNISKSPATKLIKKHAIEFSPPRLETIRRDISPIIPGSSSDKARSKAPPAKTTTPTQPPKIDPKGKNLWPRYPRRARQRGIEGEILLRIKVNAKGRSIGIEVLKSSGHDILDEAAVDALKNWHFQPGRRGTKPVEASMDMPVVFRLQ